MIFGMEDKTPWWREAVRAAAVAGAAALAAEGIKAGFEWLKERFRQTKEEAS